MENLETTTCVIYGLKHIDNEQIKYVGQTRNKAVDRFRGQKAAATRGTRLPLYDWMRKHGNNKIVQVILEHVADPKMLDAREKFWIAELGTYICDGNGGLNCDRGGSGDLTRRKSISTRQAMSESAKRRFQDPEQRKKHGERAYYNDPDWRRRNQERVKTEMESPERREVVSRAAKEWWADPKNRNEHLAKYRKHWDDPEFWKRMGQRDYYKDPAWRADVSYKVRKTNHIKWHINRDVFKKTCQFCTGELE